MGTQPAYAWGLRDSWANSPGQFIWPEMFETRSKAIASYNRSWGHYSSYAKDRRKGKVMAVRVVLTEGFTPPTIQPTKGGE